MDPFPKISAAAFQLIAAYVCECSGIELDQSKEYLVENRLGPLMAEIECTDYLDLYHRIKADASGVLTARLIDAISTQETSFYRDQTPFDLLSHKLLPEHRARAAGGGTRRLRIWSAACATGQEAYSAAMAVRQSFGDLDDWQVEILGTDISAAAISRARSGLYSQLKIERSAVPAELRHNFRREGDMWRMADEVRTLTRFDELNLMQVPATLGRFDIVLCRNVIIYFSLAQRRRLFEQLAAHLQPHGALILGSSEMLHGVSERYVERRSGRAVYYQLRDA